MFIKEVRNKKINDSTSQTGNGRIQKSAYSGSQYGSDILSCQVYPHQHHQHQPAVNYYANSIYLSRDVPLLFRNGVLLNFKIFKLF